MPILRETCKKKAYLARNLQKNLNPTRDCKILHKECIHLQDNLAISCTEQILGRILFSVTKVTSGLCKLFGDFSAVDLKGYVGDTTERNDKLVLTKHNTGLYCKDPIYFALNIGRGCDYTKIYRNRQNTDKTLPLFSTMNKTANKFNRLQVATKFELWARFVSQPDLLKGQKVTKRLLRYPNQMGVHFWDFFQSGETSSAYDRVSTDDPNYVVQGSYRSSDLLTELEDSEDIFVVIYAMDEVAAETLHFSGSKHSTSWFSENHLRGSLVWNFWDPHKKNWLKGFHKFALEDEDQGRYMVIQWSKKGCDHDQLFMTISCPRKDKGVPCKWGDYGGSNSVHWNDGMKRPCGILYTHTDSPHNFASHFLKASPVEIYHR